MSRRRVLPAFFKHMNKEETIGYLKKENIDFTVIEHPAVFTVAQADRLSLPHKEAHAKNLFIRDEKKRNYYLLTIKEDKVLDLKELRRRFGTKPLSFASSDDLERILGVKPGSVSALALLNDKEHAVHFFIDSEFQGGLVAAHPMENTATVFIRTDDLISLVRKNGNDVTLL